MERCKNGGASDKRIRICAGDIFSKTIDVSQVAAIGEGIFADAGHALGNSDGGQAATIEGSAADAGNSLILFCTFVT